MFFYVFRYRIAGFLFPDWLDSDPDVANVFIGDAIVDISKMFHDLAMRDRIPVAIAHRLDFFAGEGFACPHTIKVSLKVVIGGMPEIAKCKMWKNSGMPESKIQRRELKRLIAR